MIFVIFQSDTQSFSTFFSFNRWWVIFFLDDFWARRFVGTSCRLSWSFFPAGMHFGHMTTQSSWFLELFPTNFTKMIFHLISVTKFGNFSAIIFVDCLFNPFHSFIPFGKNILYVESSMTDAFVNQQSVVNFWQSNLMGETGDDYTRVDLDAPWGMREWGHLGDANDLWRFGLHLSKDYSASLTAASQSDFLIAACINKYIV